MNTAAADYDREQRRAGKVHRRDAPVTEEELTQLIEEQLQAPPTDLTALMAWGARCAELVQRPGGWRSARGLQGVGRSLPVLLRGTARTVVGGHLAALVIRYGRAVATTSPQLLELALGAVRDLATTDLPGVTVALERYGAGEGMVEVLQRDPAWLPLVLQCFLAGVVVPAVVGQQLLKMTQYDVDRLTPIIMECFHAHHQTYQAALVARELLAGEQWQQAAQVLYEAVAAGGRDTDRVLLGGDVVDRLRFRLESAEPDPNDPMVAVLRTLLQRGAATRDFRIANYFATTE